MTRLFEPYALRDVTARNRIWVSPMCQYQCREHDGMPGDWHLMHLGQFAVGGAGLILTEATAVEAIGRISPRDTGIWTDAQAAAWRRIVDFVHAQGAPIGMQLAHAGRKASSWAPWDEDGRRGHQPEGAGGWSTVAPSALPFGTHPVPRALTSDEVAALPATFAAAAERAVGAGFDLLELHAAHGYLLHQFLSPLSNRRDDAYGGSTENRARLLLDIVRAVRARIPAGMPLLVRVSASDWTPGGLEPAEVGEIAGWAREAGADLVDVSSGGLVGAQRIRTGPGYQVPFAATVHQVSGAPVGAVGMLTEAHQIADIVDSGMAEIVLLARELLRDPHFPLRAADELGVDVPWPGAYERARPTRVE
ncbi:NADH:flavin oxidoreductase/NADH oxidase [Pseudolysinimonas sp.]|uniref:NADH:flavin oxidoreductase/NADH oxidase n=1 Tax=Pseudolysinimonas sp. TaxID=2680009 RepID=UPI003F7FF83D